MANNINTQIVLVKPGTHVTATSNYEVDNVEGQGCKITLDITVVTGTTPTLDLKVQYYDAASGKWIDITGASMTQKTTAAVTDDLTIFPSIAAVANRAVSNNPGRRYRVLVTLGGGTPDYTMSLGAQNLV